MKNKILLLILLLSLQNVVISQELFSKLSTKDLILQSIYLGITSIDWIQTKEFMKQNKVDKEDLSCNKTIVKESNSYLGEEPSQEKIDRYIFTGMILHTTLVWIMPSDWRSYFQGIFILFEIEAVKHNYDKGYRGIYISINF